MSNQFDKNKVINTVCHCKTALQWKRLDVVMLNPCEHLIHLNCFEALHNDNDKSKSDKSTKSCPICNIPINSITKLNDYKNDPKLFQKCVDILSMTNIDNMMEISYDNALFNIPEIVLTAVQTRLYSGFDEGHKIVKNVLKNANVKIKVSGLEKIQNGPKVFIANHTCHLDFLSIFYVLKTGFAATALVKDNPFTKKILDIVPTHLIEIGKSTNAVANMKKYVEKYGSICLFPEGMFSHPATISRFRTGAFHIGYPVYAIVLKYKNYMADTSILDFVLKTHSEHSECIDFIILGPFYPPFDDEKIELIRFAMAEYGNLLIARTSNRDVNNTKKK